MQPSFADIEAFAARFYQGQKLILIPYIYTTTFSAVAQSTTQTGTINIAANADFIMTGVRHRAAISAAQTISSKTAPFLRLKITDTGSSESFSNAAVDLENQSENGQDDRGLVYPRIISGRSALSLELTHYGPAETYSTVDIALIGVLVRAYGG